MPLGIVSYFRGATTSVLLSSVTLGSPPFSGVFSPGAIVGALSTSFVWDTTRILLMVLALLGADYGFTLSNTSAVVVPSRDMPRVVYITSLMVIAMSPRVFARLSLTFTPFPMESVLVTLLSSWSISLSLSMG